MALHIVAFHKDQVLPQVDAAVTCISETLKQADDVEAISLCDLLP